MKPIEPEYVFALCNPGAERALKAEVVAAGLDWRPSYQRRGFVTFKIAGAFAWPDLTANVACARRLGVSLGKFSSRQEAEACLREHGIGVIHWLKHEDHRIRPQGLGELEQLQLGEQVGTVIEFGDDECWAGVHRHAPMLSPWPGGDAGLEMPAQSPSRAWLKLEEAVRFFGLEFSADDIVVELGCAPGGVVHALLQRGVSVIGVDPAKMAEVVMRHAVKDRQSTPQHGSWFFHCRKPAALVSKRDLGRGVTWFMSDMNQAPDVVLRECARFVNMAPSIRGVLITLKLTEMDQVADKHLWLAALREMGFSEVRLQQLAVHHREFALLGLQRGLKPSP